MAPKYKFTYFDLKGLGEPARYILSYGGADFEDVRVQRADWPKLKPSSPFGKLPFLEVDGKVAHQSTAICRYLAKQFGIAGSNDWEALEIDAVVDTITDLRLAVVGYHFEENEASKAKKKATLLNETLPTYLAKFDKMVKDNGGYFVGGKCSWADLVFVALHEFLGVVVQKSLTADYPNLKALVDKVHGVPAIKAWVEKRPVTDW